MSRRGGALRRSSSIAVVAAVLAACQVAAPTDSADGLPSGGLGGPAAGTGSGGAPSDGQASSVAVDTLYAAGVSGLTQSTRAVIGTSDDWEDAWGRMTSLMAPPPEAPPVDFGSVQVVVVGLGQRASGGYGIELAGVERAADGLTVTVREVTPGPGCVTTQALTQPVLAFTLPADAGPVRFQEERSTRDCF
jgi:hypothetical protein